MKNKVFGIGLHKTGTTSLYNGLQELGYCSIHGTKKNSDLILKSIFEKRDPLYHLHQRLWQSKKLPKGQVLEGFADLYAIIDHFVFFDVQYPDAKFVLTTRDNDGWVQSIKNQIAVRHDTPYFHYWYYQNELQWVARKEMHERTVREYFAERPGKLLEIDVTRGDGFDKLCPFLGLDAIDRPFPHKNNSSEKSRLQRQNAGATEPD